MTPLRMFGKSDDWAELDRMRANDYAGEPEWAREYLRMRDWEDEHWYLGALGGLVMLGLTLGVIFGGLWLLKAFA